MTTHQRHPSSSQPAPKGSSALLNLAGEFGEHQEPENSPNADGQMGSAHAIENFNIDRTHRAELLKSEQEAAPLIARKSSRVRGVLEECQLTERVCLIIVAFALVCGTALAYWFDAEPECLPRTPGSTRPVPQLKTSTTLS